MHREILVVCLLMAALLVSGCTTQVSDSGDTSGMTGGEVEASAYDQIEQEMEEAIEDIDLEDLEGELLT